MFVAKKNSYQLEVFLKSFFDKENFPIHSFLFQKTEAELIVHYIIEAITRWWKIDMKALTMVNNIFILI